MHRAWQAFGIGRGDQQMHVIGHQHIGMDSAIVSPGRFGEPVAIEGVIFVRKENGFAVVAALDDVQRLIAQKIASEPRHDFLPHRSRGGDCRRKLIRIPL